MGREKFFRQAAHLNVVSAQPGKVLDEHRRNVPILDGLDHLLGAEPLHGHACDPVVHKNKVSVQPFFFRRLLKDLFLWCTPSILF